MEKNPGPSVSVDATKTIHAPYCQGNASIYSKVTKITLVDDMTQTMIVDIQLYSSLSLLARQSMLMLTELVTVVWLQCLSNFSTLNTVTVILVTSMVIPELRGITTKYATYREQHLKYSWH